MVREMTGVEALIIAGATVSAFAAVQQGRAANAQAQAQSDALKQAATVKQQQADREITLARLAAENFTRARNRDFGTVRANRGVSGVESGSGSPLAVDTDRAAEVEFTRQNILNFGAVKSTRLQQAAAQQRSTASNVKSAGEAAQTGSLLRAGSLAFRGLHESEVFA